MTPRWHHPVDGLAGSIEPVIAGLRTPYSRIPSYTVALTGIILVTGPERLNDALGTTSIVCIGVAVITGFIGGHKTVATSSLIADIAMPAWRALTASFQTTFTDGALAIDDPDHIWTAIKRTFTAMSRSWSNLYRCRHKEWKYLARKIGYPEVETQRSTSMVVRSISFAVTGIGRSRASGDVITITTP